MAASKRRRTFERARPEHPLTPLKQDLLKWVAYLGISAVPQLCALGGFSEQACRKHLRDLYDMGFTDRTSVSRAHLADVDAPNDPSLLFGRAPVIHFVTREGRKYLIDEGILEPEEIPDIPQIGPKNGSHVAHELQIRDARVWLHLVHRANPAHGGLERWQTGGSSIFPLNRSSAPYEVRPDAWFVYQLGRGVFVGFVEIDRGTEKSPRRWEEKFVSYALLMGSGLVQEYTGYQKGRVLITAPNYNRLVSIGAVLAPLISQYPHLQDRFWVTEHKNLSWASLYEPVWYIPGSPHFQPLVSR